jgi:hypothetical protein
VTTTIVSSTTYHGTCALHGAWVSSVCACPMCPSICPPPVCTGSGFGPDHGGRCGICGQPVDVNQLGGLMTHPYRLPADVTVRELLIEVEHHALAAAEEAKRQPRGSTAERRAAGYRSAAAALRYVEAADAPAQQGRSA